MTPRMKPLSQRKISTSRHQAMVSQRQALHNGLIISRVAESEKQYTFCLNRIQRLDDLLCKLDGSDRPWYTQWFVRLILTKFTLRRNKRLKKAYLTHFSQLEVCKRRAQSLLTAINLYRAMMHEDEFVIDENEISRIRETIEEQVKYSSGWNI